MPLYDYGCEPCGLDFEATKRIADRRVAPCPQCGEWAKQIIITAPQTDVFGSEQYCDVNDIKYTSRREYESKMRQHGWEPCGDKKGGARSEYGLKGTLFSYSGQSNRAAAAAAEK
jgi:putative FmdB family regulatory protein